MALPHDPPLIDVRVVLALPQRQQQIALRLAPETTARVALGYAVVAGLDLAGTDLDAESVPLAVHGEQVEDHRALADGDRLEVLRPLRHTPMELRRLRAGRKNGQSADRLSRSKQASRDASDDRLP